MSSINFNSHDEYFQPNPDYPPTTIYAVHPVSELREYARLAIEYGVKLEIECFSTGAFWAIRKMREGSFWTDDGVRELEPDLLPDPLWATLFFGWGGQGLDSANSSWHPVHGRPPSKQCELERELHAATGLLAVDRTCHWLGRAHPHRNGRLSLSS